MTWTQNIAQWRSLPEERKLQIRREAIALDVAQSMAFEREPVSIELIRAIVSMLSPFQGSPGGLTVSQSSALARKTPRGSSKPDSERCPG
jgi:hypothetical protein